MVMLAPLVRKNKRLARAASVMVDNDIGRPDANGILDLVIANESRQLKRPRPPELT